MKSTTVRVTEATHRTLCELSATTGRSMQDILSEAVAAFWRRELLEGTNEAYAALRTDERAWTAEVAEREAWEATLRDAGRSDSGGD